MLQVLAKQEYLRMEDGLEQIAKNQIDPFKRMTVALRLIREFLTQLYKLLVDLEILMNVTTPFRRKLTTHSGRN